LPLRRPFPTDPEQHLERTCFQTGQGWSEQGNLRSDVSIVDGIDPGLPGRIESWRNRGYRIHVMTGVSWGNYQDYLYGRFDGINREDEAQTDRHGNKISHGGDVYYMCPGTNYGRFLCVGVQRALEAGTEAIHLEEPEFWVHGGYSEGFKREWKSYYGENWQPPHSSVDAQWRASKLKYYLYRRALQQVFDHVQEFNRNSNRNVRCYVPTHSLLNYAHWRIVSPESSLARLNGCNGYIAQVWTGTSRTPNVYRGKLRERTFETAFLEYGAMQNLVKATGRTVWYLNDPIEDNPEHDWDDYRANWESTLVASLLQPEVWQFEVAPWPERVFAGRYPAKSPNRQPIPPAYATELQTVMNALNQMRQDRIQWDCGTETVGLLVSDSLMFQRGDPEPSDPHLSNIYGLALPLLKRGIPVNPVQLENVTIRGSLDSFKILLLTYHGMKPLTPDVHASIAGWVRKGGVLLVFDDDSDPYRLVRDWWNTSPEHFTSPREHLFRLLEDDKSSIPADGTFTKVAKGAVTWVRVAPADMALSEAGDQKVAETVKSAAQQIRHAWHETAWLILRRGPFIIAAGLDETIEAPPKAIRGKVVNLFDPDLKVRDSIRVASGARIFALDLERAPRADRQVLASACKALPLSRDRRQATWTVEGVGNTSAVMLLRSAKPPRQITLDRNQITTFEHSRKEGLLWIRFPNEARPRELKLVF
jgi:hypothetical protein